MMNKELSRLIMGLFFSSILMGCAGPTSPFGGLNLGSGDGRSVSIAGDSDKGAAKFTPERQVLHEVSNIKFEIKAKDIKNEDVDLRIVYNDRDVTNAFQKYSKSENDILNGLKYSFEDLRLSPAKKHKIEFFYRPHAGGSYLKTEFMAPICPMKASHPILYTGTFTPSEEILTAIRVKAKKHNVNPSFLFGLIAQESGFDESAVSSARAVGLTQVTPLAAAEIKKIRKDWVTYAKFDEESPAQIKKMIINKKVTEEQDWRLDPERSIEGGLVYLQYLENYWADEKNAEILKSRPTINYGAVILASYNSGAARVKKQILESDTHWLEQAKLKEALRYVNSIQSYCYHYSSGVVQ